MFKSGRIRGEKIEYSDGIGYSIWTPLNKDEEDEGSGLGFDFSEEDIDSMIDILGILKNAEAKKFEPDEKFEAFIQKREERKKTWWYKLYDFFDDVGISFSPFDWAFRTILVTRKVTTKNSFLGSKICKGFVFGPVTVTW